MLKLEFVVLEYIYALDYYILVITEKVNFDGYNDALFLRIAKSIIMNLSGYTLIIRVVTTDHMFYLLRNGTMQSTLKCRCFDFVHVIMGTILSICNYIPNLTIIHFIRLRNVNAAICLDDIIFVVH